MKQKLVRFSSLYNLEDFDRKPLPDDIYNSEGAILARKGQTLSRGRLFNAYVLVDDVYHVGEIPESGGLSVPFERPEPSSLSAVQTPSRKRELPPGFELTDTYEEETADQIESYLADLEFEPIPKIKATLRSNIHNLKEIFEKKIVNNMVFLASPHNEQISRQIAQYLFHITDVNLLASDYLDMLTSIRNEQNYVTFSHPLGTAFYTMAIAKKLKMLRDDLIAKPNLGRWLPIKTRRHPKPGSPVPFSNQLLKYIDGQKTSIQAKYEPEVREELIERIHNLMYDYINLNPKGNYPSLSVNYDEATLIALTMAAINIDIGKLCIPNRIINKPGELTDDEWEVIRSHPSLSISKLKEVNVNLPHMFVHIIGHHLLDRENGYPPVKVAIPPHTKIVSIADLYDAMTSPRFYGRIHRNDEVIRHLATLRDKGIIDLPLYLTAVHTFEEYNHEFVKRRRKAIAGVEAIVDET